MKINLINGESYDTNNFPDAIAEAEELKQKLLQLCIKYDIPATIVLCPDNFPRALFGRHFAHQNIDSEKWKIRAARIWKSLDYYVRSSSRDQLFITGLPQNEENNSGNP